MSNSFDSAWLDRELAHWMAQYNVPGVSLAVISDGRISWAGSYGVREAGRTVPLTADTLFQTCSLSKAVTSFGLLRLVEQGVVALNDDANRYLASWQLSPPDVGREAPTIRQLLSHTAGVNLPWSAGYHPEQEVPTLLEVLNGDKPSIYPAIRVDGKSSEFRYSGGGYCILEGLHEHGWRW